MPPTIEFFFDLASPWTCLAFYNIQPPVAERGVRVRWRWTAVWRGATPAGETAALGLSAGAY